MEPAHRDLHWHPPDLAEREALFDQVDTFLAARASARQLPLLPDEPVRSAEDCPDCGSPDARPLPARRDALVPQLRLGRGAVLRGAGTGCRRGWG